MAIDARTMLFLSLGIAVIAAGFLALEWRALRDRSLLLWSAGFATIVVGCSMSPLREGYSFLLGVWVANGLLVVAHFAFLFGVAHFTGRKVTPLWWALLAPWICLAAVPAGPSRTDIFGVLNSALVAILALKAAQLLLIPRTAKGDSAQLGLVFLAHGVWYCIKTSLIFLPGAFVDLIRYKGFVIQISLFEGIMVEVLLALLMVASVRRRRERHIGLLAEIDPLTGVFNRRAFESRAANALDRAAAQGRPSALMLFDIDRFKAINDSLGHGFGDRILTAFTRTVTPLLPSEALFARLGGDEFVMLLVGLEEKSARELGARIRAQFAETSVGLEKSSTAATVSIGVATFTGEVMLPDLMDMADAALYEAKRRGRDQLCLHSFGTAFHHRPAAEHLANASCH